MDGRGMDSAPSVGLSRPGFAHSLLRAGDEQPLPPDERKVAYDEQRIPSHHRLVRYAPYGWACIDGGIDYQHPQLQTPRLLSTEKCRVASSHRLYDARHQYLPLPTADTADTLHLVWLPPPHSDTHKASVASLTPGLNHTFYLRLTIYVMERYSPS